MRCIICFIVIMFLTPIYVSSSYDPDHRYTDNTSRTTYQSDFFPSSRYDLYRSAVRSDFLNNLFNHPQLLIIQKNDKAADFYTNKLAHDLNVADYVGFSVQNNAAWSSYSNFSTGYEKQDFSNVKYDNGKLVQCDMTTERDGKIREQITKITYNEQKLPTQFTVNTFGNGKSNTPLLQQNVSDIVYTPSNDKTRYNDTIQFHELKAQEPETIGFAENLAALKQHPAPATSLASAFTITTQNTTLAYRDVTWHKDLVTRFNAAVRTPAGETMHFTVASTLNSDEKIDTLNVAFTRNGETTQHTWNSSKDIDLQTFTDEMKCGVNPIKILGSGQLQISDGKAAFLTYTAKDVAHAEAARQATETTVLQKVSTWIATAVTTVKDFFRAAAAWIQGLFAKEAHTTVQVSDATVCKVSVASGAGEDVSRATKKAETVLDKITTWVSNVFSSGYGVKTTEVAVKDADAVFDMTVNKAGKYTQASKAVVVGMVDMTRQGISDGIDTITQSAASIKNNVSSIGKNLGTMNNQNLLMTMLYTYVNVQQGIATYKAMHSTLDEQSVMMMEKVATFANMQEVADGLKNVEDKFASFKVLNTKSRNLAFRDGYNCKPENIQINLVRTNAEITTGNLTVTANAGIHVVGFNGLACNVSASAQYVFPNNSVMSIRCDNNLGQEMRQVYGGFNYNFGNNATVRFEADKHWLLFTFNLKY